MKVIKKIKLFYSRLPFVSDRQSIKLSYKHYMGKELNLDNPRSFNEKIQWLKLYNRKEEYVNMVDKCEAKKYVAKKIGEKYTIPNIAIYDDVKDINLDVLPKQFVLKATHDSGSVIVVKDKDNFDIKRAKHKLKKALKKNFYNNFREWVYKDIKPRILAEVYLEDQKYSNDITDYKWYCFNGEPKCLYVSQGLSDHSTATISFFDLEYNQMPFRRKDYKACMNKPQKPKCFEEMIEIARRLSENIPFVRVDLYEIDGKVYFSELTFYPAAGYMPFEPEEWDYVFGKWLELPNENNKK